MSDFTTEGFAPFPNTYEDNLRVASFSALTDAGLDHKVNEYGRFLQRTDLMQRARTAGERVLDHLLFELAYRDGIYDEYISERIEDELCA